MARGNRREAIFLDDDDRKFFLHTLGEACWQTGWRVHACVQTGNHYHWLVENPEPKLSVSMKWLQNATGKSVTAPVDFARPSGAAAGFGVIVRWFRSCLAPPPATILWSLRDRGFRRWFQRCGAVRPGGTADGSRW